MEKKEQKKRIAANTLYTMGGLIFMNGVLQLIITPLLNRYMGAKQLGELLYITGLVAIICPSRRTGVKYQPSGCAKIT